MSFFFKEPTISVEENNLKKIFVDKSETVEIMSQESRRYFRLRQKPFEKFWYRL